MPKTVRDHFNHLHIHQSNTRSSICVLTSSIVQSNWKFQVITESSRHNPHSLPYVTSLHFYNSRLLRKQAVLDYEETLLETRPTLRSSFVDESMILSEINYAFSIYNPEKQSIVFAEQLQCRNTV